MYSKTTMMGRIVNDIEAIETKTGNKFISNTLAVSRDRKGKDGSTLTDFWDFTVGGTMVPVMLNYVKKGDLILLEGRMEKKSYEKDGIRRENVLLRVDHIQLIRSSRPAVPAAGEESMETQESQQYPWEE